MAAASKIKIYTRRIAKVVLDSVVEWVTEVGEQVVDFSWPERHVLSDGDICAAAKCECKCVSAGCFRERAASRYRLANGLEGVGVNIGVCSPEKEMNEGLNLRDTNLDLRSEQVCKQVSLNVARSSSREGRTDPSRYQKLGVIAAIALKIGFDAEVFVHAIHKTSTTAI